MRYIYPYSGALLTQHSVGRIYYLHYAATRGELISLEILEVATNYVKYRTEKGGCGMVMIGEGGKARNWLIVDHQVAADEILYFEDIPSARKLVHGVIYKVDANTVT